MTASEVRRQLIEQFGYSDEELPTSETIRRRLNDLGYTLKRVLKTKPIKKIPETEAIFQQVEFLNSEADNDPHTLRISIDAKVAVTAVFIYLNQILITFSLCAKQKPWFIYLKFAVKWENLTEVVKLGCQLFH